MRNQLTCLSHNCSIDEATVWSRYGVMHSNRAAKGVGAPFAPVKKVQVFACMTQRLFPWQFIVANI